MCNLVASNKKAKGKISQVWAQPDYLRGIIWYNTEERMRLKGGRMAGWAECASEL
jgi:hypothetical protein